MGPVAFSYIMGADANHNRLVGINLGVDFCSFGSSCKLLAF